MLESALYIVPTPIGNMQDITLRAIEVLKNATLIAAEDTRHSKLLLDHIGVKGTRMISCHDHNEEQRVEIIKNEIEKGGAVALISDAGTPLISDPGYRVVSLCVKQNVKVVPLPGPCAAITALEMAGLPTDSFLFAGFLPVKDKELREKISTLTANSVTTVFYEAPRRVKNTAKVMAEIIPEHDICVCRELTKAFESAYRMKVKELPAFLEEDENRTRGEFVLVVGPAPTKESEEVDEKVVVALKKLIETSPVKVVCSSLSDITGINRNRLYDIALKLKSNS